MPRLALPGASLRLRALAVLLGLAGSLTAQGPPPYTPLVWDQDWSYLSDPTNALDWSDSWKYLKLPGGDSYVSVGGQVRERGEYADNPGFGAQGRHNGYLLQRYLLRSDWHFRKQWRVFVEAGSSFENGSQNGPRPGIDQSTQYLNQAFADYSPSDSFSLRAGRQFVPLGSARLFAIGAGLNVEQPFDGVKATVRMGGWTINLFGLRPVSIRDGIFTNEPNHQEETWGVYASHPLGALPHANVDLYYIGLDHKISYWAQGVGREQRENFGGRLWAKTPTWYYDFEYTGQLGRFGSGDIRAWGTGWNAGYRFHDAPWKPEVELDGGVTSGDHNLSDHTLGTFNPLFPNGSYLSQSQLIGPYNLAIVRPKLELALSKKLTFSPNLEYLWRESSHDGVYNIAGFLTHSGGKSDRRYVGAQIQAELDYSFSRHLVGSLAYEHFFPGAFLRQTPPNRAVNFFSPQLTYTF